MRCTIIYSPPASSASGFLSFRRSPCSLGTPPETRSLFLGTPPQTWRPLLVFFLPVSPDLGRPNLHVLFFPPYSEQFVSFGIAYAASFFSFCSVTPPLGSFFRPFCRDAPGGGIFPVNTSLIGGLSPQGILDFPFFLFKRSLGIPPPGAPPSSLP